MSDIYEVLGIFLFIYAITDYAALSVEIIFSGITLGILALYFFPVANAVPVATGIFIATMVLLVLRSKWTLVGALALIPVAVYYMIELKDPRTSGLLWMMIGLAFGSIDNIFLGTTATGDIIITIILFIAAGPLALPIYVAQIVYGKLFLERDNDGRKVYPMGTAVFIGYLALSPAIEYLKFVLPWILP